MLKCTSKVAWRDISFCSIKIFVTLTYLTKSSDLKAIFLSFVMIFNNNECSFLPSFTQIGWVKRGIVR